MTRWVDDLRLEKLVAAFKLLMFRLDNLDTVHDFHQTSLQSLGLPDKGQRRGTGASRGDG